MMARSAALLLIASQLILIWMALSPSGRSAIYFVLVGHPLVLVGSILGVIALQRRLSRESAARKAAADGRGTTT